MRTSDCYVVTIETNNFDHAELLHELKLITKIFNKHSNFNFRIQRVGRLGKNNPNAIKYKNNVYKNYHGYGKIRVADAAKFDLYLYNRDIDYSSKYKDQRDAQKALVATLKSFAAKSLAYL